MLSLNRNLQLAYSQTYLQIHRKKQGGCTGTGRVRIERAPHSWSALYGSFSAIGPMHVPIFSPVSFLETDI